MGAGNQQETPYSTNNTDGAFSYFSNKNNPQNLPSQSDERVIFDSVPPSEEQPSDFSGTGGFY